MPFAVDHFVFESRENSEAAIVVAKTAEPQGCVWPVHPEIAKIHETNNWQATMMGRIVVHEQCYDCCVFHFGKPRTPGQWIGHILAAIVALLLVWWMLRVFVV